MPIATPEIYADMLDRAKKGASAYPAINVSSSQTITAAIRGFAEAESDGIIQFSWAVLNTHLAQQLRTWLTVQLRSQSLHMSLQKITK